MENDVCERMVYRMFFLGPNFVSGLICTLRSSLVVLETAVLVSRPLEIDFLRSWSWSWQLTLVVLVLEVSVSNYFSRPLMCLPNHLVVCLRQLLYYSS